ncbi:hypothetical protein KC19_VG115900 [Ceratodon purpureus]|uniref:Uncharacterized protein n=1 Tax=Ceratodon purpureus TaxID=3225 RepID=A0A8T0HQ04_CERPU|nr:hypothetical protein KC19_VG115900 [Ceratodon purpureus]
MFQVKLSTKPTEIQSSLQWSIVWLLLPHLQICEDVRTPGLAAYMALVHACSTSRDFAGYSIIFCSPYCHGMLMTFFNSMNIGGC